LVGRCVGPRTLLSDLRAERGTDGLLRMRLPRGKTVFTTGS